LAFIGLYIIFVRHVGIGINLVEILGNAGADREGIRAMGGVWEGDIPPTGRDLGRV